jgi:hypothetical protein
VGGIEREKFRIAPLLLTLVECQFILTYLWDIKPARLYSRCGRKSRRFSATQKYQRGFPLEIYRTNTLPVFNSVLRPNIVPGQVLANHIPVGQFRIASSKIINTAAYAGVPKLCLRRCGSR